MFRMPLSPRASAIAVLWLLACASAEPGGGNNGNPDAPSNPDGSGPPIDGPGVPPIDAPPPPIDAPPLQTITLSQGSSMAIVAGGSPSCNQSNFTRDNSYYRVFRLADFGITRPFTAERVDFGVEEALAGAGTSQTVQVRLHRLAGTLLTANMTNVAGQNVQVNNGTGIVIPVALSPAPVLQPDATLVAEVFVPDGLAASNTFFIGSNAAAETAPSYIRSTTCTIPEPQTMASISFPDAHIVLTVSGTY